MTIQKVVRLVAVVVIAVTGLTNPTDPGTEQQEKKPAATGESRISLAESCPCPM
ncbi:MULTISPECIES: hypothetical protein [Salinispora]|uniref:hypothetical protein n=1 Tax=Salinispora TaxID=168694 RepID=UPI0012BC87A1|nr:MULTISPECIES: hypothetical protein [Salinispora]